jgi:hypothetical protein
VSAAYIEHYHDRPHSRLDYRDAPRGPRHLGRCSGSTRGLNRQRQRGALHRQRSPGSLGLGCRRPGGHCPSAQRRGARQSGPSDAGTPPIGGRCSERGTIHDGLEFVIGGRLVGG